MLRQSWFELRPYVTSDEQGAGNMSRILGHVDKFLLIISRDAAGAIRMHVRVPDMHRATLATLEGIETVRCRPFEFGGYAKYSRYVLARHCALSVIPKNAEAVSPYRIFGDQMSGRAYLAVHARKISSAAPINSYISYIERGIDPTSIFRFFATGKRGSPGGTRRENLKQAQEKISTRSLFACRISSGVDVTDDERIIRGTFPAKAFKSKALKPKKINSHVAGSLALPMFGGAHIPILSDAEILWFLSLPTLRDIGSVEFEIGRVPSQSSGVSEGSME